MVAMPDAPLPPALPEPPSRPPSLRPPPPGALVWMAFLFGPSVVFAFGCVVALLLTGSRGLPGAGELMGAAGVGAVAGMLLGTCLVGGLALATRFYTGMVGRIVGGLLIGLTLLIGLAGVAFAGCMCVMQISR